MMETIFSPVFPCLWNKGSRWLISCLTSNQPLPESHLVGRGWGWEDTFFYQRKRTRNCKVGEDRWMKGQQQDIRKDLIFIYNKISFNFSSLFLTIWICVEICIDMTTSTKTFRQVIAARVPYWLPLQSTYFIEHPKYCYNPTFHFSTSIWWHYDGSVYYFHWKHPFLKVYQQFHACILLNVYVKDNMNLLRHLKICTKLSLS